MYNIIIQALQVLLLICICFILIKKQIVNREEQFVICNTLLKTVSDIYYDSVLNGKIETLKTKYDLNPKSRTNSIAAFTEAYNSLLAESAKQIIRNHISKKCLKTLLDYYDMNSVILTIIFYLKR